MRILLLTHYFEPENGAPQRRWAMIIRRWVERGDTVDVIAPPPHHPGGRLDPRHASLAAGSVQMGEHGATVHRVGYIPHDGGILRRTVDHAWVALRTTSHAIGLARRGRLSPDVVIATAPALPTLLAGAVVARRLHVPLIAEMRDAWPDLVSHLPGGVSGRGLAARVKRTVHEQVTRLQRRADHVVTTTSRFAAVLRERGVRHVSVIRNGTTPERYEAIGPGAHEGDELRALYIGTIGRSQGLDMVVRAAHRLRADGVPIRVRIVGAGADAAALRTLNHRLGLPVELLGAVSSHDVQPQYQWADTCIVSLRDWEPFTWTVPSKLYELMATGKHMTAIVAGEAAELVVEAESGDVVAPGDQAGLEQLWRGLVADRRRLEIGDTGRRWVREHVAYDALSDEYAELIERVVAEARRGEGAEASPREADRA